MRDYGTDIRFYNAMDPPYDAKNGPMDSLDEVVIGSRSDTSVDVWLGFNRNGIIDTIRVAGYGRLGTRFGHAFGLGELPDVVQSRNKFERRRFATDQY